MSWILWHLLTVNETSVWLKLRVKVSWGNAVISLFIVGQCSHQHLKHKHTYTKSFTAALLLIQMSNLSMQNDQTCVIALKLCGPPELLSAMKIPHLCSAGNTSVGMRVVKGLFPGWILFLYGTNKAEASKPTFCNWLNAVSDISDSRAPGWFVALWLYLARRNRGWGCWEWRRTELRVCSRMACSMNWDQKDKR